MLIISLCQNLYSCLLRVPGICYIIYDQKRMSPPDNTYIIDDGMYELHDECTSIKDL